MEAMYPFFILKALSPRFMNQNTHEITIPKQHSKSIEEGTYLTIK